MCFSAEDREGLLVVAPSNALSIDLTDTAAALLAEHSEITWRLRFRINLDRPHGNAHPAKDPEGLLAVAPSTELSIDLKVTEAALPAEAALGPPGRCAFDCAFDRPRE